MVGDLTDGELLWPPTTTQMREATKWDTGAETKQRADNTHNNDESYHSYNRIQQMGES